MSNFFLQLGAEAITVIMYIATITLGIFAGMFIRKWRNKNTAN